MSTEKNGFEEAKEALETAKDTLTNAKTAFRKFKTKHGVRTEAKIKDEKIKEEFLGLQKAVTDATAAKKEVDAKVKELKPAGKKGGGEKYGYVQIADAESGELRDMTAAEKKRWRAHARKVAVKDDNDYNDPSEVPFDADFFKPKVKKTKEDKKAEKEAAKKEEAAADTKEDAKEDAKEEPADKEEKPAARRRRKKD